MRCTISAVLALCVILVLSIFVGQIINILSTEPASIEEDDENSFVFRGLKNNLEDSDGSINNVAPSSTPVINDSPEHLIWFLQISDIHISLFFDESRARDLKEFCNTTVDIIKPAVVLASGDLTDAKTADNIGSRQYVEEWRRYMNVLLETKVQEKTLWLDVRGNHDTFNVPDLLSQENYFRNYSIQGRKHRRSYMAQIYQGGDTYSFVAVDACLEPGPRRPFNFIGVLGLQEFDLLRELERRASQESNYSVWFGHYPTSCVLAPSPGLRQLVGRSALAYFCGHLHQLGGLAPNMYTLQQAGNLELELGDWKENRVYRLAAIDNGFFSFIDVAHGDWPVILPTTPKHALYVMPRREPLNRLMNSTHIRILVFSQSPIKHVIVRINHEEWRSCRHVKGPLYVAPWNATIYGSGIHFLQVEAADRAGHVRHVTQPFALDGTRLSFGLLPRLALMTNFSIMFQCMFGAMLIVCVVPLCFLRGVHHLVKKGKLSKPSRKIPLLHLWLRKMWILSTVDRIFYPLTLYALYLTAGPWAIGEILEGHYGVIFVWGIFVRGAYLPGAMTYAYGFLQMFMFHFPLTLFLAHVVERRFHTLYKEDRCSMLRYGVRHLPFVCIIALQIAFAYFFWLAYGTMAFLLGPLRTWSVVLGVVLWSQAVTLPERCLREASQVWTSKSARSLLDVDAAEGIAQKSADLMEMRTSTSRSSSSLPDDDHKSC